MTRLAHVNLVAADVERLASFYVDVLDCEPRARRLGMTGPWLDRMTGLADVAASGMHLGLPGAGAGGPTIELLAWTPPAPPADRPGAPGDDLRRPGWGHLAFEGDDVAETVRRIRDAGGAAVGEVVTTEIADAGELTVAYARDPEGNVVELQHWTRR